MVNLRKEKEKNFIGPALVMLIVFIFSGLYLVELQLNDLTKESEFTRILNIRRDQQTKEVVLYFMGMDNDLGEWAYVKCDIDEGEVVFRIADQRSLRIPYQRWYALTRDHLKEVKAMAEKYYGAVFD